MRNVILLTLDATRKDVFGFHGNERGLSPTFDEVAAKSLIFDKAQTTGPYTQASFPGILTSAHFLDYGQPKGLSRKRTLISEPLQEAGIVTAAFHSNPYLCEFFGWNRGWDIFYDSMKEDVDPRIPYIRGDKVNRKAIDWLTRFGKGKDPKPFFLWLHYMDVHEPYMPERQFVDQVDPSLDLTQDEMYALFQDVLLQRDTSDDERIKTLKQLYDIHVREIDTYFADLIDCVEGLGILDETAIVITSDHGDEFNEHGGLSHDDKMYAELIDAPLFIYGGGEAGRCDALASNADIPPTILDLFGVSPVSAFQGQALLPSGGIAEWPVYGEALDQHSKKGGDLERDTYFCREGDLKIIYRRASDAWELYDLAQDPTETRDVIQSHGEAERLKGLLRPRVRRWA